MTHARMILPALALFCAPSALALPLYGAVDPPTATLTDSCIGKHTFGDQWENFSQYIDQSVTVYLSDDAASRFNANNTSTRQLTQEEFEQAVQGAMEVWNRESRGPVFVWGGRSSGRISDSSRYELTTTCGTFSRYGGPDGGPVDELAVLISTPDVTGAGNRVTRNKYGNPCIDYGYTFTNIFVGSWTPANLRSNLVHELGHVLGLAHSFGDSTNSPTGGFGPMSVMQYNWNHYESATGRDIAGGLDGTQAHLWPWDRDCVDDDLDYFLSDGAQRDARARELAYSWRVYDPGPNRWSNALGDMGSTTKSGAGSLLTERDGDTYAPLMLIDSLYSRPLFWTGDAVELESGSAADGFFAFTLYGDLYAPRLETTSHSAVFASLYDTPLRETNVLYAPSLDAAVVGVRPSHTEVAVSDPPEWHISSGFNVGDAYWSGPMEVCANVFCLSSQREVLDSHVAPRLAFDPQTATTVVASVNTRDCSRSASSVNRCGGVQLHAGFAATSNPGDVLNPPTTLLLDGSDVDAPSYTQAPNSVLGAYDGSSHVSAAVACAESYTFSCMVAWVDDANLDGHILVARFRVAGWGIEWEGSANRVQPMRLRTQTASGARTTAFSSQTVRSQSDLSMVWADGRYLLTYKNSRVGFEEAVTVAQTGYNSQTFWEYETVFVDDLSIEAPAFVADPLDPTREVVLTWTTL